MRTGYLRWLILAMAGSFAAVWLWVAFLPMAFMEPEYPAWQAKRVLLDSCNLGDVVILGDSRPAAGIIPNLLPIKTTNLAVGGGEPIEALAIARRMLTCAKRPRLAIVSFDAAHLVEPDLYWERSVRFGFQSAGDIAALRALSRETGDYAVYEERHTDGLPAKLRDWLQEARFPPWYFSSLVHGAGLRRWTRNREILATTIAERGHYFFGTAEGSETIAADGHIKSFHPLPLLDRSFDRLISLLGSQGIEIRFIAMPVNEATWAAGSPAMRQAFAAYLAGYERRYSHFHVSGELGRHWPNRLFGDEFSHLNPEGAERFTAGLARQLVSGWTGRSVAVRR